MGNVNFSLAIALDEAVRYLSNQLFCALGFPGSCPSIFCPCSHPKGIKPIIKYSKWKVLVKSHKFKENAQSLLSMLCSGCHVPRNLFIKYTDETYQTSGTFFDQKINDPDISKAFADSINLYEGGLLSSTQFYDRVRYQYFPELQTIREEESWALFKTILQLIEDPERSVNLHLCHLKHFPKVWTPCCNQMHCFRCRTKGYHEGETCEQNIAKLDMSIVPCPSCGVFLTKGDGCNSVSCYCGKKFGWDEEKQLVEKLNKFYQHFPVNTSFICAQILCEDKLKAMNMDQSVAIAWHSRNTVEVNRFILSFWRSLYPFCPNQAIVLADNGKNTKGFSIVINLWDTMSATKNCRKQMVIARGEIFNAMVHGCTPSETASFAHRFISISSQFHHDLKTSAKSWVFQNAVEYGKEKSRFRLNSAMQFLYLHGHQGCYTTLPSNTYPRKISKWVTHLSDRHLVFANNNETVTRPGAVSSYPAAIANIMAPISMICLEIDQIGSMDNWLSFGLVHTEFPSSASDSDQRGVGLTKNSWGLIDYRSSTEPAYIAANGKRIKPANIKFKQGDIIVGIVNTYEGWFEVFVNDSFVYRFSVPIQSFQEYKFALTLSNDASITIVDDDFTVRPINIKNQADLDAATEETKGLQESHQKYYIPPGSFHLNHDQTRMCFHLKSLISDFLSNTPVAFEYIQICADNFVAAIRQSYSSNPVVIPLPMFTATATAAQAQSEDFLDESVIRRHYEELRPFFEYFVLDGRGHFSPPLYLDMSLKPTWAILLYASCWKYLDLIREEKLRLEKENPSFEDKRKILSQSLKRLFGL